MRREIHGKPKQYPTSRKKFRCTVDVPPEPNQTMEQLTENTHSNKSEILRRAIALNIKLITRTTTIKQIGELRPISELITQGEGQGGINPPVL